MATLKARGRLVALGICGTAVGITLSTLIGPHEVRGPSITFVPAHAEATRPVREYEVVQFDMELRNEGSEDALVEKLKASCGCVSFAMRDGGDVTFPLQIDAGTACPIRITIKTGGAIGKHIYRLLASGQMSKSTFDSEADAAIDVATGIRVNPRRRRRADQSERDSPRAKNVSRGLGRKRSDEGNRLKLG